MARQLSEQEQIRRESMKRLRSMGLEPYPQAGYEVTAKTSEILNNYEEGRKVRLAGRLMNQRIMGKASFGVLQDAFGKVQVYFNRDVICPEEDKTLYNEVFKKLTDLGDFIGIEGDLFKTQTGEITVNVQNFTMLSKALRPLPMVKTDAEGQVHDAFTDPELRYRQRYVDLVVNDGVKETFLKRSRLISSMRRYFEASGYLEVETPILQPIPGGAAARPFVTHHNALDIPLYLRIANELYLKRLIVGGFDGVFEFAKDFRNEGMDRTHNPEFTVMEIYVAYKDYRWMMDYTERMLQHVVREVNGSTSVKSGEREISFAAPFPRVPILKAIEDKTGHNLLGKSEEEIRAVAVSLGIEVNETMGTGKLIDEIFGECCEADFVQPTFIIDYPVEMSPLCKKHRDDDRLTERFELIVNGKELANAYTELNDPVDQRERFEEQLRLSEKGDDEAMFIDQDFLRALEYGMPPTAGMGIGIDRLTMLLTGQTSIQEVLFFPQMRPEKWESADDNAALETTGIPAEWLEHLMQMGLETAEQIKALKPTQLHQQLNGYRKKNKLELPALKLEEVQAWFENL